MKQMGENVFMESWGLLLSVVAVLLIQLVKTEDLLLPYEYLARVITKQKMTLLKIKNAPIFSSELSVAESLLQEVIFWIQSRESGLRSSEERVFSPFKNYPMLLNELNHFERQFGIGVRDFLLEIRLGIMKDILFETKKSQEKMNGLWQMAFMSLLIFGFIYLTAVQLELKFSALFLMGIFLWQIFGVMFFLWGLKRIERWFFHHYYQILSHLFSLRAWCELDVNSEKLSQNFQHFQNEVSKSGQKKFAFLFVRISRLINQQRELGVSIKGELRELQMQIWEERHFEFEQFQKKIVFFKFAITAIFFLSTYLAFMLHLFSFFMA